MKKKIIFSLFVVILTIGCALLIIFIFGSKNENKNEPVLKNIKVECIGIDNYSLDLGEYLVYDYKETKKHERITKVEFHVNDGLDFYKKNIKCHELYDSNLDYVEKNNSISQGFFHEKYYFLYYKIYSELIEIEQVFGVMTIPYEIDKDSLDPYTVCMIPGPLSLSLDNKNPNLNIPSIYYEKFNIDYDEIVKIYNTFQGDFIEKHDDYILIKGICYIDDVFDESKYNQFFISDKYLCKITKFNETVRFEIIDE